MTIKRRIKFSNTLMIILPMFLTFVTSGILFIVITSITDVNPRQMNNANLMFENLDTAQEAIDAGTYAIVADDVSIYQSENNNYIIVLAETTDISFEYDIFQRFHLSFLFMAFLLTVVFFTNRTLTRYVLRSIITPIDTLVNGVHEIRDGNLEYRIDYKYKDEFAVVCSDFNEMAQRLSDMVDRQQREENNRRELIAGISHDLRTPLTSIKAYLEGLEKGVATSEQMQEKYLDTIKSKTSDLEHIINQLFLFSKLDIGEFPFRMEDVDIGLEIKEFTECHEKEYSEKGLAMSIVENVENVCASIDVVQFRNVIINILENSAKYKDDERAMVKIACSKDCDNVRIVLMDNGPGVSEESLVKMFDAFYRSDAARNDIIRGSGLGLAISKKIIERLGGGIFAANALGGGLEITITFPILNRGVHKE